MENPDFTVEYALEVINEDGYIQDIGQLPKATHAALDRMAKKGKLIKKRLPWLMMYGNLKSTWFNAERKEVV